MSKRNTACTTLAGLCVAVALASLIPADAARGAGSVSVGGFQLKKSEDTALNKHKSGRKERDKGVKYEQKAARQSNEEKRNKYLTRAKEEYEKAATSFQEAVEIKSDFHEAWKDLGFVYRKTGDFDGSLRAYDKALQLKPDYAEAFGERAESFLWMNRLDEAKQAYMHLFPRRRDLADRLMAAMQDWVDAKKREPSGVDATLIQDFADWVAHRNELAQQTAAVQYQ